MAKVRTFNVTLTPATVSDGYISFKLFDENSLDFKVDADTLSSLEGQIRAKAEKEFRKTCVVSCRVERGERKPPGFDAWRNRFRSITFGETTEEAA